MWIFSQDSFLSIVEDWDNPDFLLVRARVKGDIEKYWPKADIVVTPDRDYLFRVSLPRGEVAAVVAEMVSRIDYGNFKENIADERRERWYMRVWTVMSEMQRSLNV